MPLDTPIIVWFRRDLRVSDNPALAAAAEGGRAVLPVYILDDTAVAEGGDPAPPGATARWWLHHSLIALSETLAGMGAPLLLRRGDAIQVLSDLAAATGARAVFWNRVDEPWHLERSRTVAEELARRGIGVATFTGSMLFDPDQVHTANRRPFTVFAPFWRRCLTMAGPSRPLPPPAAPLRAVAAAPDSDPLADWALVSARPEGWDGVAATWTPGEAAARVRLAAFLEDSVGEYQHDRDFLDRPGTSRLSPHLHWGELSVRQLWDEVRRSFDGGPDDGSRHAFLRQIGWREFSIHLLHHTPELPVRPLNPRFADFPWQSNPAAIAAWRNGRTGYPIIDAGMREVRQTGWLHNRLRMVVASFLVKHLLQPWQDGAAWFDEALVDADLANNSASWQWVAGCGTDAAPFFRIFNPVLQGRRFDPEGRMIRRFVPELAALPAAHIHEPWRAPPDVLARAGVRLGETYPRPIVDHAAARGRALAAFHAMNSR